MVHKGLVAGDISAGNRAPNAQRRVDSRSAIRGKAARGLLLNAAAVLSQDNAIGCIDVGIVHVERNIVPGPGFLAVKGRHLAGEHQAGVLLLARFVYSPAGICHCLKDIARKQVLIELGAGLFGDAARGELLAGFFNPGEVLVGALAQLLYPKQLALSAEKRRVAALPAQPVKEAGHAIIVSLCSIESAGRDYDRAFGAHVVARGVTASLAFRTHKGERHGQLSVDQVL